MTETAIVHDLAKVRQEEERRQRISELAALLVKNDKGAPLGCVSNLILIVSEDPTLAGICGYNEFTSHAVLHRPPPPPIEGAPPLPGPYPRPWSAADVALIQSYIQRVWAKSAKRTETEEAMVAVAALRRFHPVRDWLASLQWDGTPRLDSWLASAFGALDDEYHQAIASRFLIAAVRRVRRPGCKFDHMLVLEGLQGLGKSAGLRRLFGRDWITDSLPAALESKEAAHGLQGVWAVEFAEIEQIIRSEVEVIKAFLSRSVDRFRAPYGRAFLEYPRQCVLVGTTNESGYLRDSSGNRRFWPVHCQYADTDWIAANREQIWAEAAAREASGEEVWLHEADVQAVAVRRQTERVQEDVWEDRILGAIRTRVVVTVAEILTEILQVPIERQRKSEQMRVADILKKEGWERKVDWVDGKPVRRWRSPK